MPHLDSILETALYVDDMERACRFYEDTMGLKPLLNKDRLSAYDVNGASVLILFLRGGTTQGVRADNGYIPPHDGRGELHMAFTCDHATLREWEAHFEKTGIEIEGRTQWSAGGESIYFRDPDRNLLEIAAKPGLWKGY
ncbi:VOC family protein [uncultured Sulfitobacter sp.]|uniref:VOC family protein n=1 Tax=uncultured Sulfitobacter sp. TaxID=191468 RepID=UPI002627862B|nr:VOC family protein [uncultured Sulfitobacter sp.]